MFIIYTIIIFDRLISSIFLEIMYMVGDPGGRASDTSGWLDSCAGTQVRDSNTSFHPPP